MREAPPENDQPLAPVSSNPNDHASGWRAFFSVLIMGLCMSGNARPDPADFETRYQWQQMITAISACSFGALAAAAFAIKWRKLHAYWSIVWRLYLVYVAGAFLAGFMHGGNVAAYATGAASVAGMLTATSGVALFYWRNAGTNAFFYLCCFIMCLGLVMMFLS